MGLYKDRFPANLVRLTARIIPNPTFFSNPLKPKSHRFSRFSCPRPPHTLEQTMSKLSFDIDQVIAGKMRLSDAQAMELYHQASMHELGQWAMAAANRLHPEDYRTYVIDRNINYTNV